MHDMIGKKTKPKYLSSSIQKKKIVVCVSINFDLEQVEIDKNKILQ